VSHGTQGCTPRSQKYFGYGTFTLSGGPSQQPSPILPVSHSAAGPIPGPNAPSNPHRTTVQAYHARWVWALPPSLAATKGISVDVSSSRYLDGSVPWVSPPRAMCSPRGCTGFYPYGLPHSATPGSQDVCSSPGLFAAYHGLPRRPAPRHPPWTLSRLTILSLHPSLIAPRIHRPRRLPQRASSVKEQPRAPQHAP
jgi:hypothetical protein